MNDANNNIGYTFVSGRNLDEMAYRWRVVGGPLLYACLVTVFVKA